MTLPSYANRDSVLDSLVSPPSSRLNRKVDELLEAASRDIEHLCHLARFYPEQTTMTFDWPQGSRIMFGPDWKLYLGRNTLAQAPSSMTVGGTSVAAGDILVRPDDGPPFTRIEIDINAPDLFQQGDTWQRAISVTGLFGYQLRETQVATLASLISDSDLTLEVSNGAAVGAGDLIRIGTERMVVTNKTMVDTIQDLTGDLSALESDDLVGVADGTAFSEDEVIQVGSEQMRIESVTGNNLTVERAYRATTLSAHTTGDDIFASRRLTIDRGVLGTTSASHSGGAGILRFQFPPLVQQLAVAHTIDALLQEQAGYARVSGSGENARETRAVALKDLRERVYWKHARKYRLASA